MNDNKPARVPALQAGTGRTEGGDANLERTGSHEIGHSARLRHPVEEGVRRPFNLMNQTRDRDAGTIITRDQILQMKKAYDDGKLNDGVQKL